MDEEVVTELIQSDFNEKKLSAELSLILDATHRNRVFANYYELEHKLGGVGASDQTAQLIYESIQ